MRYQWLFIDADDTLFDYKAAEKQALEQVFLDFGLAYSPACLEHYQQINQRLWHEFELGQVSAGRLQVQRFEELGQVVNQAFDAGKISDAYLVALSHGTQLLDGALETVLSLAEKYHLALITNGLTKVQKPRLAGSKLANIFHAVIISEEIGFAKPDPAYFEYALQQAGRPDRGEVLVIGDSLNSDMRGANRSNLDACWYNPQNKTLPADFTVLFEIQHLTQLLTIL